MKIGLASPNSDYGVQTADMAVDLEQRGYDSLWVGEHSHIPASRETPHPEGIELPRLYWHTRDAFTSLGAAAAVTSRIKLVTGVCLVLEHEVLDLAKSVATLDHVSDGRFLFGVGVGWNREELANVSSVPWSQRYIAMRETVAALRTVWTHEEAEFSGTHVSFAPSWSYPKPVQQPGPPVIMGCQGKIGMQHVIEYADGWCPLDDFFSDIGDSVNRFRAAVADAGRDPDDVPISMYCFSRPSEEKLALCQELGVERVVMGAPDEADKHHRFLDRNQYLVDTFTN